MIFLMVSFEKIISCDFFELFEFYSIIRNGEKKKKEKTEGKKRREKKDIKTAENEDGKEEQTHGLSMISALY